MTFLNLGGLSPKIPFHFLLNFGSRSPPVPGGLGLGRIFGGPSIEPFFGGGVKPESCIDPPKLKAHPPQGKYLETSRPGQSAEISRVLLFS